MKNHYEEGSMKYKSRFALPEERAEYVCGLARLLNVSPDEMLAAIVLKFEKDNAEIAPDVWYQVFKDRCTF